MAAEKLQINKRNKSWVVNTIGCLFTLLAVLSICTLIMSHTFKTDGNVFLSISKFIVYLILILAGILYIKRKIFSRWLLVCTIPIIIIKPLGYIFLTVFHLFSGTFDVIKTFFSGKYSSTDLSNHAASFSNLITHPCSSLEK